VITFLSPKTWYTKFSFDLLKKNCPKLVFKPDVKLVADIDDTVISQPLTVPSTLEDVTEGNTDNLDVLFQNVPV